VSCVNYNIFRSKLIFVVRFSFFIYAEMLGNIYCWNGKLWKSSESLEKGALEVRKIGRK